jgi:microcystin-dependent protein
VALPYVGEIRMFAGNFAPAGWMFCEGQLLPIAENETLFQLIGTTYGGDGESTFALPDLRGRVPVHQGNGFALAQAGGDETVTLTVQQLPPHSHAFVGAAKNASRNAATGHALAQPRTNNLYGVGPPDNTMAPQAISARGGSQPHDNMQPYICIDFIISLFGIFPSPV